MKKNPMILLSAGLLALSACKSTEKTTAAEPTADEKKAASINDSYIDKSIRPQDDFFMYANGNWIKNNPVPPSESRWGSFNELEQNNKRKLTEILENLKGQQGEPGSEAAILGVYYMSYMDMNIRNEQGIAPIEEYLTKIAAVKSKSELPGLIAQLHLIGVNTAFGFSVDQDLMDVNKNMSSFNQGGIGLPNKEYYTNENKKEILGKYKEHITAIFTLLNDKNPTAKANEIVDFETKLASAMMTPAEMRIPENTYNKVDLDDVDQQFGKFDFETYLKNVGSHSFDTLIVAQPEFVKQLAKMTEFESLESWKNYMTWCTVNHFAGHLSQPFIDENFNFYGKVLSGKTEMKPLNEQAIDEITHMSIGELLGKAFVAKYFSENAQKRVNEMVDNLLIVFKERIKNLDWMSEDTKKEAIIKLDAIGRKLGYPSKWEDFSKLSFEPINYVGNMIKESMFSRRKNFDDLLIPVDKDRWGMPAHMVNAYYHPLLNEIAFPAGIMQPPFFDENADDATNYGRIGMVIGHEFTHGFDDMGSKFAADGTFKNWWTDEDRKLFDEKTGTLGETFAAFCPFDGYCVNPALTMGENIADLGGLTLAYHAYERTKEFKAGEQVDGFTPAQRFFIAYAQLWKINYTPEELKNRIANDPHSPGMYRVNGPLKNCPEFFKAFDVKEGDPMRNPDAKVAKIW